MMKQLFKKSQSGIEFLILTGVVIFFFVLFLSSVQLTMSDKTNEMKNLAIKDLAQSVQDEIILASTSSEGYTREFRIPDKISGMEYSINLTEGFVYIITDNQRYSIALPVPEVHGNVQKGGNLIQKINQEVWINS